MHIEYTSVSNLIAPVAWGEQVSQKLNLKNFYKG